MARIESTSHFFSFIERQSARKYYPFYLSILLMLVSWMLAYPRFHLFDANHDSWQTIMLKASDLTNNLSHIDPRSWLSKKVFRLTIPLFAKLLYLSPVVILVLQVIAGYFIYFLSYKVAMRITKDSVQSTLITAGIAFLFFGRVAYFDVYYTWFDTFAFLFILLGMVSRNAWVIFVFSTLAAWTDERAYVALSILFLFHFLIGNKEKLRFRFLFKLNKKATAVLLAMLVYPLVRLMLALTFNMHTPGEGANFDMLKETYLYAPLGIWTFLEGFWLIFIPGFYAVFVNKDFLRLVLYALPLIALTLIALCVTDITRSGSYLVPMIFVLIAYLSKYQSELQLRSMALACFLVSLLFPAMTVCIDWSFNSWFHSTIQILPNLI